MFRSLRVIAVAVFAATQSGCWEGTTREVLATVLTVEGPAIIRSEVGAQFIPILPGAHPGKGTIIETPALSRAGISLLPNLLVQLDRNARLEIVRLALTKDGNETGSSMRGRFAEVKLMRGRMLASQVWGEASARFKVVTPQGELVTSSNSLFWVEADENKTRVTCISGVIGLRVGNSETVTRIPPGFVGEWSHSNSTLFAAERDALAQEALQEGLDVEQKLRVLAGRNRFLLPKSDAR